jgi:hypothetical protein
LSIVTAIGAPVVIWRPERSSIVTPDRMRAMSGSRRCVVKRDVPGRRRSRSAWMSASSSASSGGQPSTTQPIAGPWLSPKVVTRKRWPKVLWDMARAPALHTETPHRRQTHADRPQRGKTRPTAAKRAPRGAVHRQFRLSSP